MSHRATLYAKELRICPNGEPLSKMEKLVLYCLADYHQDKMGQNTYPSLVTLAEESLMDVRSCRRLLGSLERKGVIVREYPNRQGAGHVTFYRIPELDKKGGHSVPLSKPAFSEERGTKGGKKEDRECTPLYEEQEHKQKQLPPIPPASQGANGQSESARSLDRAVDQVMSALSISKKRDRPKLRAVIELEAEKGEPPPTIALAMIAAYRKQDQARLRGELTMSYGVMNFFERGVWKNEGRWHWDEKLLRLRSEAGVGAQ